MPTGDAEADDVATGSEDPFCRICLASRPRHDLFSPCKCKGSAAHIHRRCLERWHQYLRNSPRVFPVAWMARAPPSPLQCQSCGFEYRRVVSPLGRFITNYVGLISVIVLLAAFGTLGVGWHLFDDLHEWFAIGQLREAISEMNLGEAADLEPIRGLWGNTTWAGTRLEDAAAFLKQSLCAPGFKNGVGAICRINDRMEILAPLLVGASFVYEGWLLLVLAKGTGPLRVWPLFYASHIVAYVAFGSLYPFILFQIVHQELLSGIETLQHWSLAALTALSASLCTLSTLSREITARAPDTPTQWIDTTLLTLSRVLATSNHLADACAVSGSSLTPWQISFLAHVGKVAASLWLLTVQYYYLVVLGLSMTDLWIVGARRVEVWLGTVFGGVLADVSEVGGV